MAASPAFVWHDGRQFSAGAVVVTTGTFLRGLIHLGEKTWPAGRVGEAPAHRAFRARSSGWVLRSAGSRPARRRGSTARTIDWAALENAARRRSAGAVLGPDGPDHHPADPVRHHPDHAGDPRGDPGQCASRRRCIPARSRAPARAIARRSRTRSCASASATAIQIFLEPEGLDDGTVYPNGISTSLPERSSWRSSPPFRALSGRRWSGLAMPSNMTMSIRASSSRRLETKRLRGPVPGRPDQRHHRLRGGGGARASSPASTRRWLAGGADRDRVRPRRRLSGGDDRRPGDPRGHRALSDVHLAGRIPADAAGRQCRPAPDRARASRSAASAASAARASRGARWRR